MKHREVVVSVVYRRPCQRCGEEFETRRPTKRFCSGRCKQQQYRRRVARVQPANDQQRQSQAA